MPRDQLDPREADDKDQDFDDGNLQTRTHTRPLALAAHIEPLARHCQCFDIAPMGRPKTDMTPSKC